MENYRDQGAGGPHGSWDAQEAKRLRNQLVEYDGYLQEMRKANMKNVETLDVIQRYTDKSAAGIQALTEESAAGMQKLAEESLPLSGLQLVDLAPGEDGWYTTTSGDPQIILENVDGRVVRTLSYTARFEGEAREVCLYYTTAPGQPYSQDNRVFPGRTADGSYVFTLPRTTLVSLRLDPCSPDENATVRLKLDGDAITLNAADALPGGASYWLPSWYQTFCLILYPALAAAALSWLRAVWRTCRRKTE